LATHVISRSLDALAIDRSLVVCCASTADQGHQLGDDLEDGHPAFRHTKEISPMDTGRDRSVAGVAVANGVVTFISVASLALFFAVGKPFGAINDWTIGLVGVLSGLLAAMIRSRGVAGSPGPGVVSTGVAVVGAAIVVAGSALVISQTTGFLLAGLVESLGFALIGLWLIVLNWSTGSVSGWSRQLRNLGLAAGIVMALGIIVTPGIAMGVDNADTAPGWIWLGFVGWLGIFFLYPVWSIWFGNALRRGRVADGINPAQSVSG
jgi:hypothetical protein